MLETHPDHKKNRPQEEHRSPQTTSQTSPTPLIPLTLELLNSTEANQRMILKHSMKNWLHSWSDQLAFYLQVTKTLQIKFIQAKLSHQNAKCPLSNNQQAIVNGDRQPCLSVNQHIKTLGSKSSGMNHVPKDYHSLSTAARVGWLVWMSCLVLTLLKSEQTPTGSAQTATTEAKTHLIRKFELPVRAVLQCSQQQAGAEFAAADNRSRTKL